MRKPYETPQLVNYGRIADHTFYTPHGQYKGCTSNCHMDSFNEPSSLGGSTGGS